MGCILQISLFLHSINAGTSVQCTGTEKHCNAYRYSYNFFWLQTTKAWVLLHYLYTVHCTLYSTYYRADLPPLRPHCGEADVRIWAGRSRGSDTNHSNHQTTTPSIIFAMFSFFTRSVAHPDRSGAEFFLPDWGRSKNCISVAVRI